ncbi:hypothetical protein Clacol_007894 [Clathrus columnatus]|uniref:F-box domain-containing protein n=1 Tax=Clathrus columnatus TaxID=1419009 RepID=A0AAV5AJE6_9AGAM|nr:hypothetical protein Clacol_007894 [Clathrus columnatus]
MHPIFGIREIVDEILSWIPREELTTTARVNSFWFFASLPNLWTRVKLMEALRPLVVNGGSTEDEYLVNLPTPAQWDRFVIYSEHVRVLLGCGQDVPILMNATRWRPRTIDYFFPNLHSLIWHTPTIFIRRTPDFSFLLSPRLQNVSLELFGVRPSSFQLLCETLSTRVQTLRTLQLNINGLLGVTIKFLNPILKTSASNLIQVQMPPEFQTEETLQWLRKLPRLRRLSFCAAFDPTFDEESVMNTGGVNEYHDEQKKESFRSLEKLTFTGSQRAFFDNFLNKSTLSSLAVVYWHTCLEIDDPSSFFRTVSIVCPLLTTLTIGDFEMYLHERRLPPIIPWTTVRVILNCKFLTGLSLHCCRVSMTPEELVEVLTSRPYWTPSKWEALEIYTADPLSIFDFLLYARYCPHLKTLGIHLNGNSFDDTAIKQAQEQVTDNRLQDEHVGPNRFTRLTLIKLAFSSWRPLQAPRFVLFLMKKCDVEPSIEPWQWRL